MNAAANPPNPSEARAGALLGSLNAMSAKADASGKAIDNGARARLEAVQKRLEELRPTVLTSSAAADEYQSLVIERHRLQSVVMAS